ncbi:MULTISPECIES: MCE family protein [unclassified Nocardioides]|uniref:MCE family protein n=1 Tax=unclassified Nocardioides TaxID=2615069 RepID=UPI000702E0A0|nr:MULTISPECIES: MCE family protein [unclassified Nocardioides]KRC58942.1 mammalian cell entry protein [Nocardioides sp. Root79]KRC76737.1 mammalian cell entry protein [Nocardioides sp. Root240]
MTRSIRSWRSALAGLLGLAVLTGCSSFDGAYDLPLPGHEVDADDAFEITVYFKDVLNVVPRSPVMVDDVTVGEVSEVERSGWNAKVKLLIRKDVELPDNAIADIRQVSLLGEKYVALEAPKEEAPTGRLAEGDTIDLAKTGRNPEVEEVLGALSFLLSGGGVAQLGTITREANQVMSGREDRLRNLLSSLDSVVGTVDQQKVQIINALESLNNLTSTLNSEKQTISDALDATGPAIEVLSAQHDELIDMLGALDRLGKVGTRVINASKEDVLAILEDLSPILRRLRQADEQLAPGLNLLVSFPFPQSANDIVQGDYADTIARVDIDLTNLFHTLGLPAIQLPDLGQVLDQVGRCLKSGSLTSTACARVLSDLDLLKQMKADCKKVALKGSPVCKLLNSLPNLDLSQLLNGGLLGPNGLLSGLTGGLAPSGSTGGGTTKQLLGATA